MLGEMTKRTLAEKRIQMCKRVGRLQGIILKSNDANGSTCRELSGRRSEIAEAGFLQLFTAGIGSRGE